MAAAQQKAMEKAQIDALRGQRMQSEMMRYGQQGQGFMQAGESIGELGMKAALIGQQIEDERVLTDSAKDIAEGAEVAANSMNWYQKKLRYFDVGGF